MRYLQRLLEEQQAVLCRVDRLLVEAFELFREIFVERGTGGLQPALDAAGDGVEDFLDGDGVGVDVSCRVDLVLGAVEQGPQYSMDSASMTTCSG
ncbi:hypothetical protein G6022_15590 [Dietzia sp. Cai40]|uniref:hypothetical protein n=1 Tax=Dietzia sp. Cai40 TaxID=1630635 RepID=UPI0015F9C312|nr:hypothetical protein [Dietzia sp. Cai40]MBB1042718.1 hypothetical protein [Dietzia sp. Cai40]